MKEWEETDCVIVGGGFAGLAAGYQLTRSGVRVVVLEARDRLGGRVHTVTLPDGSQLELGAEFIHGRSSTLTRLARKAGLRIRRARGKNYCWLHGAIEPGSFFWEAIESVLWEIAGDLDGSDRPIANHLRRLSTRGRSPFDLAIVRSYLEGFNAADLKNLSTHALIAMMKDDGGAQGDENYRLQGGYGALIQYLAREIATKGRLHLASPVETVEWNRKGVRITARGAHGEVKIVQASAAILAVPHTVLRTVVRQDRPFRIAPPLPRKFLNIQNDTPGYVVKCILEFRKSLWEKRFPKLNLLTTTLPRGFKTWWSLPHQKKPRIVAWVGGPEAKRLLRSSPRQIEALALKSLATLCDLPLSTVKKQFRRGYYHNWYTDPFAQGAYAYPAVKRNHALPRTPAHLGPLYLAGDAFVRGSQAATVVGAIESGFESAEAVRKMLRRG